MLQRVLVVTFAQALRSAATVLLPLSFIALVAWATAGSASGTTSDPIRAAIWLWLGAHHVHFDLTLSPSGAIGYLSYLPIGALFVVLFVLRSGFKRAITKLDGDYSNLMGAKLFFAFFYSLVITALALLGASDGVRPVWPLATTFAFLIAFTSASLADHTLKIGQPAIFALRSLALLLGLGFLIYSFALINNFKQGELITQVLAPGIFGTVLLLILNLAYLPNTAIASLSYISGAGFAVGAQTHLSPFTHDLGQIPALPLLAGLPVSSSVAFLSLSALVIAVGALLAYWSIDLPDRVLWQSFALLIILLLLLAYLSSGSLITAAMGAIGVSVWQFGLALGGQLLLGIIAMKFIPLLARRR
jgi:hypothetical protein